MLRPYIDRMIDQKGQVKPKTLSALLADVYHVEKDVTRYLIAIWETRPRVKSLPSMPIRDRANATALFDTFKARGLKIPNLNSLSDYEFAVVCYRFLVEVTPSFKDGDKGLAKRRARYFYARTSREGELALMAEELLDEYTQQRRLG